MCKRDYGDKVRTLQDLLAEATPDTYLSSADRETALDVVETLVRKNHGEDRVLTLQAALAGQTRGIEDIAQMIVAFLKLLATKLGKTFENLVASIFETGSIMDLVPSAA